jgi:outer membrane protein OmpA-like peptidoglycan-associated protein
MRSRFLGMLLLFVPILAWSESKVSINKTSFLPGETIIIQYSTGRPPLNSAWLGIIPSNIQHGKESENDAHDVNYAYIAQAEGSVELAAPLQAGSYDIRMNYDGAELASATFQVQAVDYKTSIKLDKNTYTPGEQITVTFTTALALPKTAWLGVIPSNVPHGKSDVNDQHDVSYQYVEGKKTDTLKFEAPEAAGSYDFRLHDADGNGTEIGFATFQVSSVKLEGTLKLEKKVFAPGEDVDVEFTAPEALSPRAWIGMIPSKVPHGKEEVNDQHDIQWQYLEKKSSGKLCFVAPPENGSYDLRMNSSDNNGVEITSTTFEVGGSLDSKAMATAIAETGKLTLYGVQFDFNKATIKPESEPVLKEVGTLLQQDNALKLRIEGHTDNVGKPAYNLDLSKKRAESVKAYLTTNFQIDAARLTSDGFGDTRPIAKNDTEQGRAQNRRVELVKQ